MPSETASTTAYRAETVGSLLRPDELVQAREQWVNGDLTTAQFKAVEDRAVDACIAMQEAAGLDVVSDGELRRMTFVGPLSETIDGVTPAETWETTWKRGGTSSTLKLPLAVTGRIARRRSMTTEEFVYARARAHKPVKVTLPSPLLLAYLWSPEHTPAVYPDVFDLFEDGADILRAEIRELLELGCEYIQIDAPELAMIANRGADFPIFDSTLPGDQMLDRAADLLDSLVPDAGGATFGLHVCRGNNAGRWMAGGSYDECVKRVLSRATAFDTFLLEYDDERSGGFEPLTDMPSDATIVLGLLSTKFAEMESPDVLETRIEDAARFHARDRLALSTQCGFASSAEGNPVTPEVQEQKLRMVADIAHRVWH